MLTSISQSFRKCRLRSASSIAPVVRQLSAVTMAKDNSSFSTQISSPITTNRPTGQSLLKSLITHNVQTHYDNDSRSALFSKSNPQNITPGSIVRVNSLTSTSKQKTISFAGVVISIRRKGIDTSMTVRNYVLGTGVEQCYKVYSPMITEIKLLKRGDFRRSKLYYLRDQPKKAQWNVSESEAKEGGSNRRRKK
ncbi:translation protein SH3-like domain-containing protein [Paraphysoderma sedebokerense]|nr:translation protein SH3-like domain-containing protein [Paraphysoderma sedebokerense]